VAISNAGYNTFVLKYRAGLGGSAATEELAAALSFILRNADTLAVDRRSYSLWGSSAGARMAASIGSHGAASFGGDNVSKPATVVMAYTGHSDSAKGEPPTFAVVGKDDAIVPPSIMARRIAVLRAAGTAVEFRRYPNVGHGFGAWHGHERGGMDRTRRSLLGTFHGAHGYQSAINSRRRKAMNQSTLIHVSLLVSVMTPLRRIHSP